MSTHESDFTSDIFKSTVTGCLKHNNEKINISPVTVSKSLSSDIIYKRKIPSTDGFKTPPVSNYDAWCIEDKINDGEKLSDEDCDIEYDSEELFFTNEELENGFISCFKDTKKYDNRQIPQVVLNLDNNDSNKKSLNQIQLMNHYNEIEQYIIPEYDIRKYISKENYSSCVDRLMKIYIKYNDIPQVLYSTIQNFARYLSVYDDNDIEHLEMVISVSYMIALKIECSSLYKPNDIINIFKKYDIDDLYKMELIMIAKFDYFANLPTVYTFLNFYFKYAKINSYNEEQALYISDALLYSMDFLKFNPSLIAASIICFIIKRTNPNNIWDNELIYYTRYTLDDIKECLELLESFVTVKNMSHQGLLNAHKSFIEKLITDNFFI